MEGAAKRQADISQATGWWAERFAREKALKSLAEYQSNKPQDEENDEERLRSWARGIDAKLGQA